MSITRRTPDSRRASAGSTSCWKYFHGPEIMAFEKGWRVHEALSSPSLRRALRTSAQTELPTPRQRSSKNRVLPSAPGATDPHPTVLQAQWQRPIPSAGRSPAGISCWIDVEPVTADVRLAGCVLLSVHSPRRRTSAAPGSRDGRTDRATHAKATQLKKPNRTAGPVAAPIPSAGRHRRCSAAPRMDTRGHVSGKQNVAGAGLI